MLTRRAAAGADWTLTLFLGNSRTLKVVSSLGEWCKMSHVNNQIPHGFHGNKLQYGSQPPLKARRMQPRELTPD
jgi:hypothetical protein